MRRVFPLCLAGALALAIAGDSLAGPSMTTVEVKVTSAGLDLETAAGAEVFLKRLSRAATQACGGRPDVSPVVPHPARRFEMCRAKALSTAVAQSQTPLVQRAFAGTREAELIRLASR